MAETFGVVYSTATGRIRSIIVPDFDSELLKIPIGKGEGLTVMPKGQYGPLDSVQQQLTKITGITPKDDLFAVVNEATGDVEAVLFADLACGDAVPGKLLVKTDVAIPEAKYDPITKTIVDERIKPPPRLDVTGGGVDVLEPEVKP